jgi:hypothetical protein
LGHFIAFRISAPDLPTERGVIVGNSNTDAALGGANCGSYARRSSTNDKNVERLWRSSIHLLVVHYGISLNDDR